MIANKLINETSPYLQQHAHNPVHWYPWGNEALNKARQENKPILLSIGYAACHWCHVMAHESFEDAETAALMNQLFINIKVDREERPDLDKVYQATHYLLTQRSGGWPLTVFLSPDTLTPFYSGTYFPLQARYQLPAFKEVLQRIYDIYSHRQEDIKQQNSELLNLLHPQPAIITDVHLNLQPLQHALQTLQNRFDPVNGGFGSAPKFPQPSKLSLIMSTASSITTTTLTQMANGGIYDQLDGGFFRYSVDAQWRIPHFEKMLYDNGQLLYLYAQAFKQTNDPFYADVARATANWVITKMQSAAGGYYSSIDADSEGHEGKYYIWDKAEVKSLLTPDEFAAIEPYYGLDQSPNFEGHWHLYISQPTTTFKLIHSANKKLLAARNTRIAPALDTKILTAWNALMIKGMLTAGSILNEPTFTQSAHQALAFIQQSLWKNNRLLATNKNDHTQILAYLDDYAFLIDALITSLQTTWNNDHLSFAINLAETLLSHFTDQTEGGFYFTADDHEQLLYRPKAMMDEAMPSGNAIAARSLLVLGHLLGETRYINAAEKTIQAGWPLLTQYPTEHCALVEALKDLLEPPKIIVIRGDESEITSWQDTCKTQSNYVFAIPNDTKDTQGFLALKKSRDKTCAYVCQGMQCLDVIEDKQVL